MKILTLDLGTSGLKAALWNDECLLKVLRSPLEVHVSGNLVEQSAGDWWDAAVALVRELDCGAIDAIGLTGHMHSLVPVDATGEPLAPVAVVPDRRAREAVKCLDSEIGAAHIHAWTGGILDPTCALAKARHFRNYDAWRQARWLLPPKDYLRYRLTGEAVTDPIDAAGTMLWNLVDRDWQAELVQAAGLRPECLPTVQPTISISGKLTPEAATQLGLQSGVPVATGGGDDIETLGAGLWRTGDAFEHFGSTGSIYIGVDSPRLDSNLRVETYPDVTPDRWLVGASTSAAGLARSWINDIATERCLESESGLKPGDSKQDAGPSSLVFLPYLAGERGPLWNADRTGAFVGLRLDHSGQDLQRAVVEGVLYSLRHVLKSAAEVCTAPRAIYTSGPLGRDEVLGQKRADIYGLEIAHVGDSEHTTSFAAMVITNCSLTGDNPYLLAERLAPEHWRRYPIPDLAVRYDHAYRRFLTAGRLLAEFDSEDFAV
jgi:xylulokinase